MTPCPMCGKQPRLRFRQDPFAMAYVCCSHATKWHQFEIDAAREWNAMTEVRR